MPKSDTWPGGVAMEPSSNLDSAGSWDSVISMISGYSEDSMEHLTAEERACIMYLEETIEALEVQEDSGFSNDEPEAGLQADKTSHMRVNDISSFNTDESGGALTNGDKTGHHILQTPEPASSPAFDRKDLNTSMNLMTQLNPPDTESVTDSKIHSELCISTDEDGKLKIVPSDSLSTGAPETDAGVIPPPSAFMDEPFKPPQPQKVNYLPPPAGIHNHQPGGTVDLEELRQRATEKRSSQRSPVNNEPPNNDPPNNEPPNNEPPNNEPPNNEPPNNEPPNSEPPNNERPNSPPELSLPAVSSGPPLSLPPLSLPPISPPPLSPPPLSPPPLSLPPLSLPPLSLPPLSPPPEAAEPRSPPAVAPRPKKLPSNIILKSHKTGYDGSSGASVSTNSDRHLSDPQRVRIEALRKLGLLPAEADSGPALSPLLSPRTRKSWAAPPSPNTPPVTPSYIRVHSPPPASTPLQSPAAEPTAAPSTAAEVLPVPAAFSDSLSAVNTPPRTPPALVKHLTPPKAFKSASLERSLPGLSSYMASQESNKAGGDQSPSQLRNNRPRPASLGSGKEFIGAQGNDLHPGRVISKEPDLRRSLQAHNAFQHTGSAQKLPRSQGISVLICPRSENEEDRRDALKKLGLIRD
ncbi:specifically androgen-regulated gene protein [Trematomus bernacchii]|uniref:specifically androgen-regulated gene protein n=1 Tax=Trematomus bernacchii TaxID=40690 RepID=UPI00146F04D5|nr:specifically androgen-regulated gene protein [Trematomus bernacchii]XP_033982422.1 specifically androgen-regulated gene protein [Trematomus bernacchii]